MSFAIVSSACPSPGPTAPRPRRPRRRLPGPAHRPDRGQRLRQVHPAQDHRRRAAPGVRDRLRRGRGGLPAAEPLPETPPVPCPTCWASARRARRCTPSRPVTSPRSTSRPSATTGTSRSAPAPNSTGSGSATSSSTVPSPRCRAARPSWSRWPPQFLNRPDVLLLDEPTNNLDLDARRRLYAAVAAWPGVMVVVSHDRALLDLVDQIADLREGAVRRYGGNLCAYEEMLAAEKEAAERGVRVAEADVQPQQRELIDAHIKLARRRRYGNKMYATSANRRSSCRRANGRPRCRRASTATCTRRSWRRPVTG